MGVRFIRVLGVEIDPDRRRIKFSGRRKLEEFRIGLRFRNRVLPCSYIIYSCQCARGDVKHRCRCISHVVSVRWSPVSSVSPPAAVAPSSLLSLFGWCRHLAWSVSSSVALLSSTFKSTRLVSDFQTF